MRLIPVDSRPTEFWRRPGDRVFLKMASKVSVEISEDKSWPVRTGFIWPGTATIDGCLWIWLMKLQIPKTARTFLDKLRNY